MKTKKKGKDEKQVMRNRGRESHVFFLFLPLSSICPRLNKNEYRQQEKLTKHRARNIRERKSKSRKKEWMSDLHGLLGELGRVGKGHQLHQASDKLHRAALDLLSLLPWVLQQTRAHTYTNTHTQSSQPLMSNRTKIIPY